MELNFLPIFTFLSLALVASHVAPTPQAYWKSVLPNTPMPKALMDLLHPEWIDEKSTSVTKGKGGVNVDTADGGNSFTNYGFEDQVLHDNRNIAVYFLENDIKPGMKMKLRFTISTNPATFLPRQIAESIPFTSNKMQEILNHFSVKPNSVEAEIMKKTIKRCELAAMKGEEKYCGWSQ